MQTNATIFFQSYAFDVRGRKLMGAQSASDGFLRAFVRHSGVDRFYCLAENAEEFAAFKQRIVSWSQTPDAAAEWAPLGQPELLRTPGCVYHPQPALAERAWERRQYDETAYSICGVTHTTCSAAAMDAIGSHMIAPLQRWDAVICTSTSVKSTIDHVLWNWNDYLAERLNAQPSIPFERPVIPLGVDCDAYEKQAQDRAGRESMRMELGVAADDIVFLFLGRLSFHAKAHPLPMYLALEQAAQRTGKKLHLIQAGWFANQSIREQFVAGARDYCPSVNIVFLDGRRPETRENVWFAADIFTSLSDNIQETFGLVPIEAMAAGLPQVISDWDGYCDTVRDGIDGFRIPTAMPPPGTGEDIARRHASGVDSYDRYIGHSSQCVSVDAAECAAAYVKLIENPALRRSMGESGRRRARERFDWSVIIGAYQELWRELQERREQAQQPKHGDQRAPHPLREDPFALFADYATTTLHPDTILTLMPETDSERFEQMFSSPLINYVGTPFLLSTKEECQAALAQLADGPRPIAELLDLVDYERRYILNRSLGWLAKANLVQVVRQTERDQRQWVSFD